VKPGAFKRFCRRCAIGLGVLLAVIALFLIEEHIRGRIELNAWMKEMRARGEKFTIAELTPPPTPPDQNGASLLMGAGFIAGSVAPQNLPSAMRPVAPGKAVAMVSRPLWAIRDKSTVFSTNGVSAFWRTNRSTQTPRIGRDYLPMLITREDLAAEVTRNSNGFAQVRAALEYPAIDHAVNYSLGSSLSVIHLINDRNIAQWLRAGSLSALFEANHETSVKNLTALAALIHHRTNEIMLITHLVRMAILQLGLAAVWEALQADGWTDEQLVRLQLAWQSDNCVASLARCLEMERAMGSDLIKGAWIDSAFVKEALEIKFEDVPLEIPKDFKSAFRPTTAVLENIVPAFKLFVYVPVWRFAWKDQDELRLLKYWQAAIDLARQQSERADWATHSRGLADKQDEDRLMGREEGMNLYDTMRFLCSSFAGVNGIRTVSRAVEIEASRELAMTAIALRRWEIRHGKLPNSLNELVPDMLPSVPIDPMDGKPLRYRGNADGTFLLYSVGTNGKDDGGDAKSEKSDGKPQFRTGRDIVWPQRASPEEIAEFEKKP
jgi:hypothetical protein